MAIYLACGCYHHFKHIEMIASILSPVPEDTVSNVCGDGENVNEMVNFKLELIYFISNSNANIF